MKIHFMLLVLWLIKPCMSVSLNTFIKNELQLNTPRKCFADFIQGLLKSKRVAVFANSKNEHKEIDEVMTYIIQSLNKSGQRNMIIRMCGPYKSRCFISKVLRVDYVIYANSSTQLDLVIRKCICVHMNHDSKFIIVVPPNADIPKMLEVFEAHPIEEATLVKLEENCDHLQYEKFVQYCCNCTRKLESFNCNSSESQQRPVSLEKNQECKIKFGIIMAPPYVFEDSTDSVTSLQFDHKYLGIEFQVARLLLDLPDDDHFSVSKIHYLMNYNKTTNEVTGLIKELQEYRVDVLMGALYLNQTKYNIEPSNSLLHANQVVIVKKNENTRIGVLRAYSNNVWIFMMAMQFFFTCIILSVSRYNRLKKLSVGAITIYLFSALLGNDILLKDNKAIKLIFITWIWMSFFLRITFEAIMIYIIRHPYEVDQINTLNFICMNNFTIYVSDHHYWNFDDGLKLHNCLIPKENFILDKEPLKKLINNQSNFVAAIMYESMYNYAGLDYITSEGKWPFHRVQEVINIISFSFLTRRGGVAGKHLNLRGLYLEASGLVKREERLLNFRHELRLASVAREMINLGVRLSLRKTKGLFYIYLGGVIIATVIFLLEFLSIFLKKLLH